MIDTNLYKSFLKERHIPALSLDEDTKEAITVLEKLKQFVEKHNQDELERLQNEPSWGLLHSMYERACEYTSASLALFAIGHVASAEALCRTAVEASINLQYSSCGDSVQNVLTYFKDYIQTEKRQNTQWLKSVERAGISENKKQHHKEKILNKNVALTRYENILKEAFSQVGMNFDNVDSQWPSIFDRFDRLGKEIDYRTIYAALCSQAHNDAEDLLNLFVSRVVQIEGLEEAQQIENRYFCITMLLITIRFLSESAAMYLGKFSISTEKTLLPLYTILTEKIEEIANRIPLEVKRRITESKNV